MFTYLKKVQNYSLDRFWNQIKMRKNCSKEEGELPSINWRQRSQGD